MTGDFWRGKRALITGHTGFKGSWLSLMLHQAGAQVAGYALAPSSEPNMFSALQLGAIIEHHIGDVRDPRALATVVRDVEPEVVFHLAAQALVNPSYDQPVETYATNVMGTVHVLDACRNVGSVRAVIVVTSDKCYENIGWAWGYRETDALGGSDPYSNSKACAELVASAYRRSFFGANSGHAATIATARAGNVIGGGDWSDYRLIPDAIRAFQAKAPLQLRNPNATRPWQHVLEPLAGYCTLATKMCEAPAFGEAWNFGPNEQDNIAVGAVADRLCGLWGAGARWELSPDATRHEARLLHVDSAKSRSRLDWRPVLALDEALDWTTRWYQASAGKQDMRQFTIRQIADYAARSMTHGRTAVADGLANR